MAVKICRRPDGLTDGEIESWRAIPAAVAVDMSDTIGLIDPAIRPVGAIGPHIHMIGRAVTASCEPPDFGAVAYVLDEIGPGDVLVIATGGNCSHAVIGEILSGHLRRRGAAGVICDGAIRDVATLNFWSNFPVFARGVTARGPTSAERGTINLPVRIGLCTVNPGDLIIGDGDGIAVLTPTAARVHLASAREKLKREEGWVNSLEAGHSARETFGLCSPELI
tara:strand:+ start:79176 stop:79844 length:669 start_codon:yes stop_codon:yes gene_type:complete